ncbi:LuxR C-terminal-related transcriptional regulator [Arthrobacter sp. TMS1-12-1]
MNFLRTDDLLPCRQPVVDTLLEVLRREDRQGALVLGETGMGKTFLLRALERSLPSGGRRQLVRATRALRTVPYGALGDVLARVPARDLAGPVPMLRAARQRLRGSEGGDVGTVLVDDAQFLDEESTYVLTQLVVMGVIRLVAFADHSLPSSAGLHGFAAEGYLDRVQLESLTDATLRAVAEHALGSGPLGTRALLRLREATGGNPMLLRAVLDHRASEGAETAETAEVVEDRTWSLDVGRHPPGGAPADLVASVLTPLSEAQRTALDLLALGGAVPAADVERLTGSEAVRSLVDQRFVVPHPADARYLALRHGLYGETLRATLPLGRKVLLREELCGPAFVLPPYGCHRLRHLEWAVETGAPVEAAVLVDAARVATELGRLEASDLFLHAVPAGHGAAVERARLLTAQGRPAEAVHLLAGRNAGDQDVIAQGAALRLAGACPSTVLALLDSATARTDTRVDVAALPDSETARRGAHRTVDAGPLAADLLRAQLLLDQGEPAAADRLLTGDLQRTEDCPRPAASRAVALSLRGEALGMLGRSVDAAQWTQGALDAVVADPYRLAHVHEEVLARHVLVLAHAGGAGQALAALEEAETAALPFGPVDALRGIVLVRQGFFGAGLRALVPALARLRRVDRQLLLPYALGVAAWGAAVLGEREQAAALIEEHRALPSRGRLDLGVLGRAFAAAAASVGRRGPQPARVAALVAEDRPPQLRACEKDVLVLAVLLGAAGAAGRLARAAGNLQGEEALILADFAGAAGAGDGALLGEVADRAAAAGLPLIALTAAARAGELQGESGPGADRRAVTRRLGRYSESFAGTWFEVPGGARRLTDLTRSENAVARLVAGGGSNRDVAEALCVSVRTIEGHLHRIYVKLGLSGRADLIREVKERGPSLLQSTT